jgi:hypothetical protein
LAIEVRSSIHSNKIAEKIRHRAMHKMRRKNSDH